MVYPEPFKAISRKLSDNIVITSCPFSVKGYLNIGARMAMIKVDKDVVVWSAIPFCDEVEKAISLFGEPDLKVSHIIVPNLEHTMAVRSFKEKFPLIKVLGSKAANKAVGEDLTFDYLFDRENGNKILAEKELIDEIGIKESTILDNFEFVYLSKHKNRELVTFDKNSKTIFAADVIFNVGCDEPLEQYSAATGYSDGYWPHTGFSYLTRYLKPDSMLNRFIVNRLSNGKLEEGRIGLQSIYKWDFQTIVMCHGNVITEGAKEAFKAAYYSALEDQSKPRI